jgi:hypothetical protein
MAPRGKTKIISPPRENPPQSGGGCSHQYRPLIMMDLPSQFFLQKASPNSIYTRAGEE